MSIESRSWARELRESLALEIERLRARSLIDARVKRRVTMYQQQLVEADALIAYLDIQSDNLADFA